MKKSLALACFLGALILSGACLQAAEQKSFPLAGAVVAMRALDGGTATNLKIRRAATGQLDTATTGAKFAPLDSLVTDANTIAQVNFDDGIGIVLGKSTDVTLSERTPNADGVQTKVFVNEGIIRAKTLATASKAGFQIHTKDAIITHRGSTTIIKVEKNAATGKFEITVVVMEPTGVVKSTKTGDETVLDGVGESLGFTEGIATAIKRLLATQLRILNNEHVPLLKKVQIGVFYASLITNSSGKDGVTGFRYVGSGSGGGTFTFQDQASP